MIAFAGGITIIVGILCIPTGKSKHPTTMAVVATALILGGLFVAITPAFDRETANEQSIHEQPLEYGPYRP